MAMTLIEADMVAELINESTYILDGYDPCSALEVRERAVAFFNARVEEYKFIISPANEVLMVPRSPSLNPRS